MVDGDCLDPAAAYTATGGTAYVVDGSHPEADDNGPGTAARPWRTISRAARPDALRPGDAVLIREGVYRESVRPRAGGTDASSRITYAAYPGETVVITGADVTTDRWQPLSDGTWALAWSGPPMTTYAEADVFRRELVVAAGDVLRPVFRRKDLEPGTFWADGPPQVPVRLVARFPGGAEPADVSPVEVAVRTVLFAPYTDDPYSDCGAPGTPGWLRVVGITFRHAANRAQWGAFCAGSEGGLIEKVRVEWTNGLGIDASGKGHTYRHSGADINGQMGWGGSCSGCLIEDGSAVGNNWKGHSPFWEAGGAKWIQSSEMTIRRHLSAFNQGPGLWLDGENQNNTIEGALVVGNEVAGIMLELETVGTLVQHNVVAATRWRAWSGSGLLSQAASRNLYLHNTVVENEGTGLWLRLDPDRRAPDGENLVFNNVLVGNAMSADEAREVQVEGETLRRARSNRLDGNVYGRIDGDGVLRSTFFLWTALDAEYRGDDLEEWRRRLGGDERARWVTASPDNPVGPGALAGWSRGDAMVLPDFDGRAGASRARVRYGGDWTTVVPPAMPPWFED